MQCRLCGSDQTQFFHKEQRDEKTFTVVQCQPCGMIQTVEHYDSVSPDYADLNTEAVDSARIWGQSTHKQPAFKQWLDLTQTQTKSPPGRLLDIGCGTGGFLQFAQQHHWQVFGFDASQAQADHSRQHNKLNHVRHATHCHDYLTQLAMPELTFSMVTLWDVLEHIRNPQPFLTEIHNLLEPDGLLFLAIPNGGAFTWKRPLFQLLKRPLSLDPWEHVFYYTPATLQHYLPKWGFSIENMGSIVCYPRPWSAFEMVRRTGFYLLNHFPTLAPQLFCLARRVT